MTRAFTALLLLASAALAAWVWSAVETPPADDFAQASARPLPSAQTLAIRDDGQRRREQVATTLARPVFSPTRRPKQDEAAPATAAPRLTALPRMTAILIDGKLRSAIFEAVGKPTVLTEGGRLGPFTIQTIEPQQVTVIGPEGKRVVRTSFSNDPPPPMQSALAVPLAPPQLPPLGVILPPGMVMPPGMPNTGPAR